MITKEAIEAAHSSADIIRQINEAEPADDWLDRAAAFAAMPGPAVRAKPLEWTAEGNGEFIAVSQVGWYHIGFPCKSWNLTMPSGEVPSFGDDLESAKAAAQADYEARILSALTPAPDLASENERLRAALGAMKTPTVWTVEFTTPEDDEGETASFAFADKGEFEKFTSAMHGRVISIFERDCVTAEDAIDRAALERT